MDFHFAMLNRVFRIERNDYGRVGRELILTVGNRLARALSILVLSINLTDEMHSVS